jgi:hypothetical protein
VSVQLFTVAEERSSPAVLGWALSYAARGMTVFPLGERSKIPATAHGCKDASTDTERILAWWKEKPNANIGVATGELSDLAVLDVDGLEGERALADLSLEVGELFPDTWCVGTGRGVHFWFRYDGAPATNSAGKLGPGLDVRSNGGYVVAPPSRHPDGTTYCFVGDRHRKRHPWPSWLAPAENEAVRATESLATVSPRVIVRGDRYAAAALRSEADKVRIASVGTRNDTLNAAAFAVARFALSGDLHPADAVSVLVGAATAAGLGETEARRTVASAFSARRSA